MGGSCQGRPALRRAFIHMVEEIPRQGRLEGCHRLSAATYQHQLWATKSCPNGAPTVSAVCGAADLRIGGRVMNE